MNDMHVKVVSFCPSFVPTFVFLEIYIGCDTGSSVFIKKSWTYYKLDQRTCIYKSTYI